MLKVNKLMVFFENALALNELSLEVQKGEIIGLIGSNSAGKTTFMNAISGLIIEKQLRENRRRGERITVYGDIFFNDKEITKAKPAKRVKMGLVLARERHPIFPESDVLENLKIATYLQKRSVWKKTLQDIYDLFPVLYDLRSRKAGFLSGGEQQMLAIGMAMIVQPKLLLLDEPLLGLSPHFQSELVKAVVNLRSEFGITIIISEQFARPVLPIIDRGYIIENGMLTLTDTGEALLNNPEIKTAYFGI